MTGKAFKAAAVAATPVFMDRDATVEKACALIAEAADNSAELVVFPETFIPTYPMWVWQMPASATTAMARLHAELIGQSVEIPGPTTDRLCAAARDAGVHLVIGVNEPLTDTRGASLFNTTVYIGADGTLLGRHRKLVPTAPERLVWTPGDGSTLEVFDTPLGRIGGLICWENYMPLARYTMYAQGTQIWVAPTWDCGDTWLATLRHIAKEGGVWVIGCGTPTQVGDIPDDYAFKKQYYGADDEWINDGDAAIVNPLGEIVAGPAHRTREIIYADIDPVIAQGLKWKLDVAGHYSRPDVFELIVNTAERPQIWKSSTVDDDALEAAED
ncbi:MAG: carbon-nitrogen hydrolase family protein [Acidobacteriota bacterium]|jgi:nitrilase